MLFDYGNQVVESEKERNLYYKFFAGYYFNEFISGYDQRVETFCSLLNTKAEEYINYTPETPLCLSPIHAHVTFDAHAYLFHSEADRGELADVLIYDQSNQIAVAIEAKFLTDWSVAKDIQGNAARIKSVTDRNKQVRFVQCLLITTSKWQNVKSLKNHPRSSYSALHQIRDVSLIILTWEELIRTCENETIQNYFNYQINRLRKDFRTYLSEK